MLACICMDTHKFPLTEYYDDLPHVPTCCSGIADSFSSIISQALFLCMPVQSLEGNKDSFIQEKSVKIKHHFWKT